MLLQYHDAIERLFIDSDKPTNTFSNLNLVKISPAIIPNPILFTTYLPSQTPHTLSAKNGQ